MMQACIIRFPGAQIFIYKRLLIRSNRKASRWRDSRNRQRGPCASDTQLDSLKRGVHTENFQSKMRNRGNLRGRSGARTHEIP